MGALTVGVVTKPFAFEGLQRGRLAEQGLDSLRKEVDALIVIPNDRLLATVGKDTSIKQAFALCDDILLQAVEGISDLITTPGIINVDFADIRSVMENAGSALMGIGRASGDKRAEEAAKAAINSPLLELSINGAKGVLFAIAGGDDLGMLEVQEAAKIITESIDQNAKVIFGAIKDEKLKKGEVKITVIATGFPDSIIHGNRGPSLFSAVERADKEDVKGKLYSAIGLSDESKKPAEKAPETKKPEPAPASAKKVIEDEDDDWSSVPAFLRRSKLK